MLCSVLTGCCQALNIIMSNDLKLAYSSLEGIYIFHGYVSRIVVSFETMKKLPYYSVITAHSSLD